jgi:hypothetical protein
MDQFEKTIDTRLRVKILMSLMKADFPRKEMIPLE